MANSQSEDILDEVFQFLDEMDNQESLQQKKIFEQFIAVEKRQEQMKRQDQWDYDGDNQDGYLAYEGNMQEEVMNTRAIFDSKRKSSFQKQKQSQTRPLSAYTSALNRVHPQHSSIVFSATVPISAPYKPRGQVLKSITGKAKTTKSQKTNKSKKETMVIRFYHPYQAIQVKIKQDEKNAVQDLYERGQFANLCKQIGLKNVKTLGIGKVKKQVQSILKYMNGICQLNPDYKREFQEMIR